MRHWSIPLVLSVLAACPPPETETGLPTPIDRPDDTDPPVTGVELTVVSYNVESGDADPDVVAANIAQIRGEAIWGFQEVANQQWIEIFTAAAADDASQTFRYHLGQSGNSDRLGMVWDDARLELLGVVELDQMNIGGTARAPLVGTFRFRDTGLEFKLVVNHLWRTDDDARHQQAEMLNTWATGQSAPLVAIGDYNFDWAVDGGESDHDAGYDLMTANSVWVWVRPETLIATQCNFSFQGVLDFTFVANGAKSWEGVSEILFPQNVHCQDDALKPDHRPVSTSFFVPDPLQ